MLSIAGELEAGEANRTLRAIGARQRGSVWIYYAVQIGMMVGGGLIGVAVGSLLESVTTQGFVNSGWTGLAGMFLGVAAYLSFARPMLIRRFRRRMTDRGLRTRFPYAMTLSDEAMTVRAGAVYTTADWAAVTEVFKSSAYWVFLVQMNPWFAPTRFFASVSDERAFLSAALSHMSPDARERSKAAVAFAAQP